MGKNKNKLLKRKNKQIKQEKNRLYHLDDINNISNDIIELLDKVKDVPTDIDTYKEMLIFSTNGINTIKSNYKELTLGSEYSSQYIGINEILENSFTWGFPRTKFKKEIKEVSNTFDFSDSLDNYFDLNNFIEKSNFKLIDGKYYLISQKILGGLSEKEFVSKIETEPFSIPKEYFNLYYNFLTSFYNNLLFNLYPFIYFNNYNKLMIKYLESNDSSSLENITIEYLRFLISMLINDYDENDEDDEKIDDLELLNSLVETILFKPTHIKPVI